MVWPLVGRDRELGSVGELLSGGSAGGVVVSGAAGVGKTRLAGEVARIAEAQGCAVAWVRATRSAASIPLGAFAAMLPAPQVQAAEGVELLARARRALVERADGRRLVLCVDDAQLLDHGSAALLHQLVAAAEAFVVITVRHGDPAPDAVRALWKDELCAYVELVELSRGEVERLLAGALGAPVDGRSVNSLWELTRGNALFLRELVLHGVEHGILREAGGIWRWRGEIAGGMRLAELVGARVAELEGAALGALEVVAVGAPLEVGLLAAGEAAALAMLEAQGMVDRTTDGRRHSVDLAHPLHGEVMRARVPRTRLEEIQRRLADAVEARGARRRADLLRMAAWRLESGAVDAPGLFVSAGEHALSALDWDLANRLAQAALQSGAGSPARLTLARALAGAGRSTEAEELLAGLEREASADGERAAIAIARARNLGFGLDRAGDADAALVRAEQEIADPALCDELVAVRAWLMCADGHPLPALEAATPLLASSGVREQTRVRAAMAAAMALSMRGRTSEAIAVAEASGPAARRHRDELPLLEAQLLGARTSALQVAGRLREATEIAERLYQLDLASRSPENTAVAAIMLGSAWLARGRVRTSLRWYRESVALLREKDGIGFLAPALAGMAQAAAQAGDAALTRQVAEEMEHTPHRGNRLFGHDVELARAWSAAADGELSRARALAVEAADVAAARGQDGFELRALHALCRLGGPETAAPRLAVLADRIDGPLAAIAAAHAAALVGRDGATLQAVAERFAELDALLVAAEAAEAAAAAYRQAGREASARAAAARAGVWLESCEDARPPGLPAAAVAEDLTSREREIALLAASGLSSREIAERLVVSVRTVDNHLQRVYRKLGVARREELAGLVTPAPRADE